jgi:hypothetical protein
VDIQNFPKYYVSYDEVRQQVLAKSEPIAKLRELNPQSGAEIDGLVAKLGRPESQLRFLPLRAYRYADFAVILDSARGDVLSISGLRPWEYK